MTHLLVIALALIAALCMGVGIVVRQLATRDVPADQGMSPTIVTALLRRPLWWAGTATAVLGYGFQALALSRGSLIVVQPLLVSSLLFALPLSARVAGLRVTRAEWIWAAVLTCGLAAFVVMAHPREGLVAPSPQTWLIVAAACGAAVTITVGAGARTTGARRAMLLAVAVGVMFGLIAVLTKVCTHRFGADGWSGLLTSPAPYALAAVGIVATVVQQSAFHAGALQTSVPTMLVLEPVVAVLLGALVLGEHLVLGTPSLLVLPIAVAAMIAATIALGRESGAIDEQIATAIPQG